jgi:hypothetical protein
LWIKVRGGSGDAVGFVAALRRDFSSFIARRSASDTTLVKVGLAAGSTSKMAAIFAFTQAWISGGKETFAVIVLRGTGQL